MIADPRRPVSVEEANRMLAQAERLRGRGEFGEAARVVGAVLGFVGDDAPLLRVYARLLGDAGDPEAALRALDRAVRLAPRDAAIVNSRGVILSQLGRYDEALKAHDSAIALAPAFEEARFNRAITLQEMGRFEDARATYLTLEGADARHACALLERAAGAPAVAAEILDDLIAAEPRPDWLKTRAMVALDRLEPGAGERLAAVRTAIPDDPDLLIADLTDGAGCDVVPLIERRLHDHPDWHEGLRALAEYRRATGDDDAWLAPFGAALARRPADQGLWRELINAFSAGHAFADAAAACHRAAAATGDPGFMAAAFAFHSASGNAAAAAALLADPRLASRITPLARAEDAVRRGALDQAEGILSGLCKAEPDGVAAWALRGLVWRMVGDDRAEWLNGQPGLVAMIDLSAHGADAAALAAVLDRLHERSRRPIGQSVRGGRQTRGNLFDAVLPEIILLRAAIESALVDFRASLPLRDGRHPALRHRDTAWRFAASWSVSLPPGGHHVSHIHPKGIFSSASYWRVPDGGSGAGEGQLELGAAPPHLAVNLPPMMSITPKIGHLVLFPSTFYHGTSRAPEGSRLTAAFDVEPIAKGGRGGTFARR